MAHLSKPVRAAETATDHALTAGRSKWPLFGDAVAATEVWCYQKQVPGPELRIRQGERLRVTVRNDLPEETTVHWHGIRLSNAMDGVPGITQRAIQPGEEFVYEFTPPDAGTFWYHPHADTLRQLGRGMAGLLIVEEPNVQAFDRELAWMLTDWRLTDDRQIAPGFGNMMEAGMSGRVGNTVTLNGRVPNEIAVRAGERVRLRLINSALARIMSLRFEGHHPIAIAFDGQPCDPHVVDRIVLGPAMRADVIVDMQGEPGRRYRITDDFYSDLAYQFTELVYDKSAPARAQPLDPPLALPRNPVPEPDLGSAERHELRLQGGMMSGSGMMGGMMGRGGMMMGRGMMGGGMMGGSGAVWAINGMSMTGDGQAGMPPLLTFKRGSSHLFAIRNDTAWWHPMHLHGHSFRVLRRNGVDVPHRQWADTVLVSPNETVEVAFVADNVGDWMFHCHVVDHQISGMMTVLRVA